MWLGMQLVTPYFDLKQRPGQSANTKIFIFQCLNTSEERSFSWSIFAVFPLLISFLFEMSLSISADSDCSNLAIAFTFSGAVNNI